MAFIPYLSKIGSQECDPAYTNIKYRDETNSNDNVMLSVARILLSDERLKTSKCSGKVQVNMDRAHIYQEDSEYKKELFIHEGSPFNEFHYGIRMQFIDHVKADEILKEFTKYEEDYTGLGWKKLDVVSQYIDKNGHVLVYQNAENQGVIVISTAKMMIQVLHLAASCLPTMMPWFFETNPLTENETAMLRSLYDQDDKAMRKFFEDAYDAGDFYGKMLAGELKGFCSKNFDNEISRQESVIRDYESNLKDLYTRIRNKTKELENAQVQLTAILDRSCNTADVEAEIVNFLKRNKVLTFLTKSDDGIYVGYHGYLNDSDEGKFRTSIENKKEGSASYIYGNSPYPFDETKAFFVALWKTHRFNLRTYCEWKIRNDGNVQVVQHCNMNDRRDLTENRIPQPHIDGYGCYSGYAGTFNNLAMKHDFIGVLNTIIASSSSVNWNDGTVMRSFMSTLFGDNFRTSKKCIEDVDGNLYTVDEVFKILHEEMKAVKPAA